jgi:hypothetical protein
VSALWKPELRRIETWKRDYRESLLDGLRVYHNPFATRPLDASVFRKPDVYQGCFDMETNERIYQGEGELLAYRTLVTYFDPNEPGTAAPQAS